MTERHGCCGKEKRSAPCDAERFVKLTNYYLGCSLGWRLRHGSGGDIFCPGALKDLFRAILFLAIADMNRDEVVAALEFTFVALRLDFRNSHPDEGAYHSTSGRSDGRPAQRSHDRTSRDKWTDPRDGKRADAG